MDLEAMSDNERVERGDRGTGYAMYLERTGTASERFVATDGDH